MRVLEVARRHFASLSGLGRRRLRDEKIIVDFLVAAHSVPPPRKDLDPVVWLAHEWRSSLQRTMQYRCSDERPPSRELDDALIEIQKDLDSLVDSRKPPEGLPLVCSDRLASSDGPRFGDRTPRTRAYWELDPLESLFNEIRIRAAGLYRNGAHMPLLLVKHVTVSPAARNGHDPYNFTTFTDVGKDHQTRVVLHVHLAGFGPESYAALARALVHECVAHVWAGHPLSDNDLESAFAEGWMDFAAEYYFKRWMPEIDEQFAHAALHHGRLLSELMPMRGIEGRARVDGHISAGKLSAWFEARGLAEHGDQAVAQLARDLNSLSSPLPVKTLLAVRVLDGMDMRLEQALRDWVRCSQGRSASKRHLCAEAVLKAVQSPT